MCSVVSPVSARTKYSFSLFEVSIRKPAPLLGPVFSFFMIEVRQDWDKTTPRGFLNFSSFVGNHQLSLGKEPTNAISTKVSLYVFSFCDFILIPKVLGTVLHCTDLKFGVLWTSNIYSNNYGSIHSIVTC